MANAQVIEEGDIFFFYRPKVDTKEVEDIEDVQRFYFVTSPESNGHHRIFMLGQKKLPETESGSTSSERRNWALNILTSKDTERIKQELLPVEYETETRGERKVGPATPAGEGKYAIVEHEGHTELAYIIELPKVPGPTQSEFAIKKEASYIISVKNPDIQAPGYQEFEKRKPEYPSKLKEKFGGRRWINADNPELLNYENAQLLLIGARKSDVEEELGIDISEEKESSQSADMFTKLMIKRETVPLKPLVEGKFPSESEQQKQVETKELSRREAPGRKGGKRGDHKASNEAPSASAVSQMLAGIKFPKTKEDIVKYAEKNVGRIKASDQVIEILRKMPERKYKTMANLEKAIGPVL